MTHHEYIIRELIEAFRKHMGEVENMGKLDRLHSQLKLFEACEMLFNYYQEHINDIQQELNEDDLKSFKEGPIKRIKMFADKKELTQERIDELSGEA